MDREKLDTLYISIKKAVDSEDVASDDGFKALLSILALIEILKEEA